MRVTVGSRSTIGALPVHHTPVAPPQLASLEAGAPGCPGSREAGPRSGPACTGRGVRLMVRFGGDDGSNYAAQLDPCNSATAGVSTPAVAVDFFWPRRLVDVRCQL